MATSKKRVPLESQKVTTGGRVYLSNEVMDEHGLVEYQLVDVRFDKLDTKKDEYRLKLRRSGAITIPKGIRDRHGIEKDDYIEMTLMVPVNDPYA